MATQSSSATSTEVAARDGDAAAGPLTSDRGTTTIDDSVVAKVVALAAREVPGVHGMGSGVSRALGSVTQRIGVGDGTQGVSVEVGERETAADVVLVVEYGESIPRVAGEVRESIVRRVEGICGLQVVEVNVSVTDLHFPGEDDDDGGSRVS